MGAAYAGLGALTSPEQSDEVKRQVDEKAEAGLKRKRPVNLDQFITVMDTANADKIAGPKQRAAWSRKRRALDADAREHRARRASTRKVPGFYFFGLALAEAYHSVMIGVSTWDDADARCGATRTAARVVTGTLDDFARGKAEGYRDHATATGTPTSGRCCRPPRRACSRSGGDSRERRRRSSTRA